MQLLEKINPKIKEKIVLALDVDTVDEAKELISELKDYVGVFKVGLQMYTGCGEEIINFMNEQKEHPDNFRYKVLKDFKTRKEALNLECELHHRYKVDTNEDFYNRAMQTSDGYDCHFKHEHWP